MWTCPKCGCQGIAETLEFCPMCGKEKEMPKVTSSGAYNTAAGENTVPEVDTPEELTGSRMDDETTEVPEDQETGQTEVAVEDAELATEKSKAAKTAFESGDKATAAQLLDEAIALDPSRADKWTKLREQLGGTDQW